MPLIIPENTAEYCWISLNMFENVWIDRSDYTKVLNMRWCSCDNTIIIVINGITL